MYHVAIVEDDDSEAMALERLLSELFGERGIGYTVSAYHDAHSFTEVKRGVYDIVFMDIGLPDMSGMEAAKKIRENGDPAVLIFITSMVNFAVRGYEANALDFIVKPVSRSALEAALSRALRILERERGIDISVGTTAGLRMLDSASVHYVEVEDHFVVYHTDDGSVTEFGSLKKAEKLLCPHGFVRCNNSTLVNMRCIENVSAGSVRVDGRDIPVSRSRAKDLMRVLNEYIGV